jgi:hypothetical protein
LPSLARPWEGCDAAGVEALPPGFVGVFNVGSPWLMSAQDFGTTHNARRQEYRMKNHKKQ